MSYIYSIEYCSVVKKSEIMKFSCKLKELRRDFVE